jgi:hypothetical protein
LYTLRIRFLHILVAVFVAIEKRYCASWRSCYPLSVGSLSLAA